MIDEARYSNLFKAIDVAQEFIGNPDLIAGAIDPSDKPCRLENVDSLAMMLMDLLSERNKIIAEGKPHPVSKWGAIADSVVNTLAIEMLHTCTLYNWVPPQSLVDLLRIQLKADRGEDDGIWLKRVLSKQSALYNLVVNPDIGVNDLARLAGVSPSTVSRWFSEDYTFLKYRKLQSTEEGQRELRLLHGFSDEPREQEK